MAQPYFAIAIYGRIQRRRDKDGKKDEVHRNNFVSPKQHGESSSTGSSWVKIEGASVPTSKDCYVRRCPER
jgi:hypothetical protein